IESLTAESDFSAFMHPAVDENLRRSALKKLFSDPRFNTMDGLDVYIEDFTKFEPIGEEMLARQVQAQNLLGLGRPEEAKVTAVAEESKATLPAAGDDASTNAPEDDPDKKSQVDVADVREIPDQTTE